MRSVLLTVAAVCAMGFAAQAQPIPGSPGRSDGDALVAQTCPTFSWSSVPEASSYQVAIYRAHRGQDPEGWVLVTHQRIAAGITTWTPSLEQCLETGVDYAWLVGAATVDHGVEWSDAHRFGIVSAPSLREVERALAVLDAYTRSAGERGVSIAGPARREGAGAGRVADGGFRGRRGSAAVAADKVGLRAQVSGGGLAVGALGATASTTAGSAGVVGEASATTGDVAGIRARASSPDGAAGVFESSAAGAQLLRGMSGGDPVFLVGSDGHVAAKRFSGDGSGLSQVDAALLDGNAASTFASASALALHTADTSNPHAVTATQTTPATAKGDIEVYDGAAITRLPLGADGLVLEADSSTSTGLRWATAGGVPAGKSCPEGYVLSGFEVQGDLICRAGEVRSTHNAFAVDQVVMAQGADGLPVIAFLERLDLVVFLVRIHVGKCQDILCSSIELHTTDPLILASFLDMTMGADQLPLLVYLTNSGLNVMHCQDVACGTFSTAVHPVSAGGAPSVAIGNDGLPVIAVGGGSLQVAHCLDVACSTLTTETVAANTVESPSIAVGTNPVVAFRDTVLSSLRLALCSDVSCSSRQTTEIALNSDYGYFPAVAIGSNGLPIVAHGYAPSSQVVLTWCLDASCTQTAFAYVGSDHDFSTNSRISLAIGADGLPYVAHMQSAPRAIELSRCNSATCDASAGLPRQTVYGTGSFASDFVLGSDGLPLLAYAQFGLATLHCATSLCY